jgi:hypothetical protein
MLYNQTSFLALESQARAEGAEIIEVRALNLTGSVAGLPPAAVFGDSKENVKGERGFVYLAVHAPNGALPIQVRVLTISGKAQESGFIDPSAIAAFIAGSR